MLFPENIDMLNRKVYNAPVGLVNPKDIGVSLRSLTPLLGGAGGG